MASSPIGSRGSSSHSSGTHVVDGNQEDDVIVLQPVDGSRVPKEVPKDENFVSQRTKNPHLQRCEIQTLNALIFPISIPALIIYGVYTTNREPDFFLYVAQHKFGAADLILSDTPQAINEIWKGKKVTHYIVSADDVDSINYLNNKNANFNELDKDLNAPVFIAASRNKLLALDTIAGLPNTELTFTHQKSQKTAFHIVAEKNHVQACSILISHSNNKNFFRELLNKTDVTGRTALIISLEMQNLQIFNKLINIQEIDLTSTHPDTGKTILHSLAEKNNMDEFTTAIAQLKIKGILKDIIDQQDALGRTAVFIAAENNNYFILRKLIESGAAFLSPLTSKAITPYNASPKIVCRNESRKILWEANQGNIRVNQNLHGENPGARIETQKSQALLLSIGESNFDQAKKLLLEGVSPKIIDEKGNTPSMMVMKSKKSESEKLELIEMLRQKGDDVNKANANQENLLIIAAKKQYHSIIKELTTNYQDESKNINLNFQDRTGNSALHYAVERNDGRSANRLLKTGAFVNIENNNGQTPLYRAQDQKMVDLLVRYGAEASKNKSEK